MFLVLFLQKSSHFVKYYKFWLTSKMNNKYEIILFLCLNQICFLCHLFLYKWRKLILVVSFVLNLLIPLTGLLFSTINCLQSILHIHFAVILVNLYYICTYFKGFWHLFYYKFVAILKFEFVPLNLLLYGFSWYVMFRR